MYYSPSGKMPSWGIFVLLFFVFIVFPLISVVYTYASWYIPYVYIKFFLTLGFGIAMAFIINKGVKFGRIRNPKLVKWVVIFGALAAIYIHWCLYTSLLLNAGESHEYGNFRHGYNYTETNFNGNMFLGLLFNPKVVFEIIGSLLSSGSFSIFGFTPKGFLLGGFWFIEFVIIFGVPYLMADQASEPFSEIKNSWMAIEELEGKSNYFSDIEKTKKEIENGDISSLLNADFTVNMTEKFSTLKVYSTEGDPNKYLTITNITKTEDSNGKEKTSEDFVIRKVAISEQKLIDLKEIYG